MSGRLSNIRCACRPAAPCVPSRLVRVPSHADEATSPAPGGAAGGGGSSSSDGGHGGVGGPPHNQSSSMSSSSASSSPASASAAATAAMTDAHVGSMCGAIVAAKLACSSATFFFDIRPARSGVHSNVRKKSSVGASACGEVQVGSELTRFTGGVLLGDAGVEAGASLLVALRPVFSSAHVVTVPAS